MSIPSDTQKVPRTVWSSSFLSAVLAVILVAEIVGLGAYGYYRVQRALDPDNLADRAEEAIRENYPEFRQELVAEIKSQVPNIAEQVSHEIVGSTPEARQQLEHFTARQLERGLEVVTELSVDKFREVLQENHDTIVIAFEKVEEAPEEAHELVLKTEADLEEQLGIDIQQQAKNVLAIHRQLNDKLERLTDPDATLEPQELLERRIVRIVRTMQEQAPDTTRFAKRPADEERR